MAISPSKTFYKRPLPSPPAIEFSCALGQEVFREALLSGHAQGFFHLIEQFSTQDEPAFCGLSSLSMVLNALAIDPGRTWKGAWRWYHDTMLDCCRPLDVVKQHGITIHEAACLANCNGARVSVLQPPNLSEVQLRELVRAATAQQPLPATCSQQSSCKIQPFHLIASYSRKTFDQTGDGHFSPIGAYNEERDLVLILDVARFKYPPHWVPLPLLLEAMSPLDPSTGRPRGLLVVSARPAAPPPRALAIDLSQDVEARTQALSVLVGRRAQPAGTNNLQPYSSVRDAVEHLLAAASLRTWEGLVALRQPHETPNPCSDVAGASCCSGSASSCGGVDADSAVAGGATADAPVVAGCGCIAPVTVMGQAQVDQVLRVARESPSVQEVTSALSSTSGEAPPFEVVVKMLALSLVHMLLARYTVDGSGHEAAERSAATGMDGDGAVWVRRAAQQLQLSPLLAVEIGGLAAQGLSAMQMQCAT